MHLNEKTHSSPTTGWSSALSRIIGSVLLFELISGLAITFGPFHPLVQWGLLFHTAVGLLAIAPLIYYFLQHWKTYRDQAVSDVVVLGYAGALVLLLCGVSGLAITGQALFGIRTWAWLRYAHLISTLFGVAATLAAGL